MIPSAIFSRGRDEALFESSIAELPQGVRIGEASRRATRKRDRQPANRRASTAGLPRDQPEWQGPYIGRWQANDVGIERDPRVSRRQAGHARVAEKRRTLRDHQ